YTASPASCLLTFQSLQYFYDEKSVPENRGKSESAGLGFVIFLVITFCVLIKYGNFSTENKKEKRGKTAEKGFHMKLVKTGSGNQNVINFSLPGKLKHCG